MGQRSRKRQRTTSAATPKGAAPKAAPTEGTTPKAASAKASPKPGPSGDRMTRGYARGRERDERIRAQLEPFGPGERPTAVVIAVVVAAVLAITNVALLVAGVEVRDREPPVFGTIVFAVVMGAAAIGMWRLQYWAILGFEALLVIGILVFALLLTVASDAFAVILSLFVVLFGGWLFWKLIRVMARIQMPQR